MLVSRGTQSLSRGLACLLTKPCLPIQIVRGAKKTAGDLKKGDFIEHKDKVFEVLSANHQKVAMRGGFIIVEGKCVTDGSKLEEKFRSDIAIEEGNVTTSRVTYDGMAEDGSEYFFVNLEGVEKSFTREQLYKLSPLTIDYLEYFNEGSYFKLKELNDEVIELEPPTQVSIKIKTTAASVKGASQNIKDKSALLTNGRSVKVPPYCESGDSITVRLPDESFVSRNL